MAKVLMALGTGFVLLWMVAVMSMNAGNPTAINAVVGIPIGAAYFGLVMYAATRTG